MHVLMLNRILDMRISYVSIFLTLVQRLELDSIFN
jgi:hypothetical protein